MIFIRICQFGMYAFLMTVEHTGFMSVSDATIRIIVCVLKRLEAAELQMIQNHRKTKPGVPLDRPEQ